MVKQRPAPYGMRIGRAIALAFSLVVSSAAAQSEVRGAPSPALDSGIAGIVPPEKKSGGAAEWPASSDRPRDTLVPVTVVVGTDGSVSEVAADPAAPPDLAAAAVAAAARWTFEPARRNGVPIAARIKVDVGFEAPAPVPPPVAPAPPPKVEEIKVRGDKSVAPVAASDFDIRVGQLRDVPRRSAEELLQLAPGVLLTNHGGEGHASGIFLRGFDAREGQDIEFRLDGVPLNEPTNAHGHGYADTHFIIPELVHRLRFTEGPFDPRQGDFAVAGSADYKLALPERGVRVTTGYGSFGAKRLLLLWGPAGMKSGTFAGADFREGDGFGPNRAYASARVMGQIEVPIGNRTTLAVSASSYAARFDSAGVVREDDFAARSLRNCPADEDSQFFCFYDGNQGGGVSRHGLALRITRPSKQMNVEQLVFATVRQFRMRQNFTGFVSDVSTTGEEQRGDGIEQIYDTVMAGARGKVELPFEALGRKHDIELGYYARYDEGASTQRRLRFAGGAPYKVDFDDKVRITNLAAYAAARLRPVRWLVLRGGARVDTFAFAVIDRNRPALDRAGVRETSEALEAYGIAFQPKASVELVPFPSLRFISSFGVGTRSSDAHALSAGEFAPFGRVRAAETGVVFAQGTPDTQVVSARAIAYATRVDRDLVFDETAGRNVMAGVSNRYGALLSARFTSAWGLDAQLGVTYAEAHLPPEGASWTDLGAGPRMPYIPRWVTRLDASLRRPLRVGGQSFQYNVAIGMTHVAPRPLPFDQESPPLFVVDGAVRVRWRTIEVGLEITNLLDRRNRIAIFNYPSNWRGPDALASHLTQQHFSAGPPRSFFGTLTVYFDAGETKSDEPAEESHDGKDG